MTLLMQHPGSLHNFCCGKPVQLRFAFLLESIAVTRAKLLLWQACVRLSLLVSPTCARAPHLVRVSCCVLAEFFLALNDSIPAVLWGPLCVPS